MATNYVSNEIEDFQGGGLYPGGTGKVVECCYILWDYDRKYPLDSQLAVLLKFQPTDGSNEGKEELIHWSAGSAKDFQPSPDGGHLIATSARTAQSESSNWAHVLKALRDNCGLPKGKLSTDAGLHVLEGSELTLARIEQKEREGLPQNAPAEGQQQSNRKRTILCPTRAKFSWENRGGASRTATIAAAPASTNATPVPFNGVIPNTVTDTSEILQSILEGNGGEIEVSLIAKAIMGAMVNHDKLVRTNAMKDAKANLETIAAGSGWTLADGKLSL